MTTGWRPRVNGSSKRKREIDRRREKARERGSEQGFFPKSTVSLSACCEESRSWNLLFNGGNPVISLTGGAGSFTLLLGMWTHHTSSSGSWQKKGPQIILVYSWDKASSLDTQKGATLEDSYFRLAKIVDAYLLNWLSCVFEAYFSSL